MLVVDNKIVAFLTLGLSRDDDLDDSYGELAGIYLLQKFWGKGLGFLLTNWGIRELSKRGYKKVSLWVLEENANARKFYEKMGFRQDGAEKEITLGKKLTKFRYVINSSTIKELLFYGN